jgi:hypothetical protein
MLAASDPGHQFGGRFELAGRLGIPMIPLNGGADGFHLQVLTPP